MEFGVVELYDQVFLGILQYVGNVQDFLCVFFGFLYCKIDFYCLLCYLLDCMGFLFGVVQVLVLQVFKIFDYMVCQDDEKRRQEFEEKIRRKEEEEVKIVLVVVVEKELVLVLVQEIEIDFIIELGGCQEVEKVQFLGLQDFVKEMVYGLQEVEVLGVVVGVVEVFRELLVFFRIQEQFQKNFDSYNGVV